MSNRPIFFLGGKALGHPGVGEMQSWGQILVGHPRPQMLWDKDPLHKVRLGMDLCVTELPLSLDSNLNFKCCRNCSSSGCSPCVFTQGSKGWWPLVHHTTWPSLNPSGGPQDTHTHHLHFTDRKTEAHRMKGLIEAPQLWGARAGAGIQSQAFVNVLVQWKERLSSTAVRQGSKGHLRSPGNSPSVCLGWVQMWVPRGGQPHPKECSQ